MRLVLYICSAILILYIPYTGFAVDAPMSDESQECLGCHEMSHPGIIADWQKSRHARITVTDALSVSGLRKKVSSESIPDALTSYVVGCAECHTLNPDRHSDTFEHNGYDVHVVVSPDDCAVCHSQEADEYSKNLMSHARNNLAANPIYRALQHSIIGKPVYNEDKKIVYENAGDYEKAEACYYCHGTQLSVTGFETRDTITGELTFPIISGWPNQGVGRINPDGSKGACSACHARHEFSMEVARKPYTCGECHTGPDVPAYKVYSASKHGNIYASAGDKWDFNAVPWTIGEDFTSPTCAACHISLVTNSDGEVVSRRTHRMNDRLPWRLFGVIYAHPHPLSPDLSVIRNKDGQPLASTFDGEFADEYLITPQTRQRRKETMTGICLNCHATSWVHGYWERFENTIQTTNKATLAATLLMTDIWNSGLANGLKRNENPFDEAVEKVWSGIWLFHANSIRFSSAMSGGGDYSVFANGAYQLSDGIRKLEDWYSLRKQAVENPPTNAPVPPEMSKKTE